MSLPNCNVTLFIHLPKTHSGSQILMLKVSKEIHVKYTIHITEIEAIPSDLIHETGNHPNVKLAHNA